MEWKDASKDGIHLTNLTEDRLPSEKLDLMMARLWTKERAGWKDQSSNLALAPFPAYMRRRVMLLWGTDRILTVSDTPLRRIRDLPQRGSFYSGWKGCSATDQGRWEGIGGSVVFSVRLPMGDEQR